MREKGREGERERDGEREVMWLPVTEDDQSLNEVGGSLDAGSCSAADGGMLTAVRMTSRAARRIN